MKRHVAAGLFAIPLLLISSLPALAQIPRSMSYQGLITDGQGGLLPDGAHTLTIRLYSSVTGGTPVYTEEHPATAVVGGLFNVIIGSRNPIPGEVPFDRAYYLGVSVDGGQEMTPRTPITAAPYALRAQTAAVAEGLAPGVTGIVRSVNGVGGDVILKGGGSAIVTRSGDTVLITAGGGGGGGSFVGVQSSSGGLLVTNPVGPVADLAIADGGVTTAKLADSAVTTAKLRDGSVTTAKLAPGISFTATGPAGGDLSGTYPNPAIAENAVTSGKIADSTITGADVSTSATLSIATLGTSGNVGVGQGPGTARLSVKGSGSTSGSVSLSIASSAGTSLLHVRDDGRVGIGTTTPAAPLDIVGGAGPGLQVTTGSSVLAYTTVTPAPSSATTAVATIPAGVTVVQILDDAANLALGVAMPAGTNGMFLVVTNGDANAATVLVPPGAPIASGQTRLFVYSGNAWRLAN